MIFSHTSTVKNKRKGCENMYQKRKYKHFILLCLVLDLLAMVFLGYRYLDRKIPDEIHIDKNSGLDLSQISNLPFVSFGDTVTASGEGSYQLPCKLFGKIAFKNIKVTPTEADTILVSGSTVGIYMETDGVLVIDTGEILSENGQMQDPAKNILKPGDYIVALNEQKISCKQDLINDLENIDGKPVTVSVRRNNSTIPVSLTPAQDASGKYKLGIWVRDDTQGIGTLTYVTKDGNFGALGHGISDVDTGELLHIDDGDLYQAQIVGIQKGSSGSPGELSGLIHYEAEKIIGSIEKNCEQGIYGRLSELPEELGLRKMEVAYKQELEIGPASILCCVDGTVREFDAEITRIDMNHEDTNKSFVIQVTDPELLELTGGIVQGMSGSPVIQNGKFVGAVTHVFIQDSTGGYGIFAENMLENI